MASSSTGSPLTNMGIAQILPALKIVSEALLHRGELAALEVSQIGQHVLSLLVMALLTVVMVLLGGFAATFMIAAMVWERPDRAMILGLTGLAYLIVGGVLAYLTFIRLRKWEPFRETANQLRADHGCVQSLLTPDGEPSPHHART